MTRCEDKTKFRSKASAEKALNFIWKTSLFSQKKKPCSSYKCPICFKWHLTSQARKPKGGK